jgi:hypothetical protein
VSVLAVQNHKTAIDDRIRIKVGLKVTDLRGNVLKANPSVTNCCRPLLSRPGRVVPAPAFDPLSLVFTNVRV